MASAMRNHPLPRLDRIEPELRETISAACRLRVGEIWTDPSGHHRVMCGDAASAAAVATLMSDFAASLAISLFHNGQRSDLLRDRDSASRALSKNRSNWLASETSF